MARANKNNAPPLTTAQQLGSLIKSARDIMRKDKGLSTDLDRLPTLTWILFLKFLDDLEEVEASKAKLGGTPYKSVIEAPYRWRDWAAKEDGITGQDLISFINNEECVRPDGSRGPGLFSHLRSLEGTGKKRDRRNVVSTVFRGTVNRMINGYLLRDVINKFNLIHFSSSDEVHTLSFLYESILKEMRDSAGDSGEFYTPRAVVKFMVTVVNPKLGDTVLDPFCGTGTTMLAAMKTGRSSIGVEIDPAYLDLAARRLRQHAPNVFAKHQVFVERHETLIVDGTEDETGVGFRTRLVSELRAG